MSDLQFHEVQPQDTEIITLIASWYLSEWKIPVEKTIQRLHTVTTDPAQMQILLTFNGIPIATGGVYDHVGLLDHEPRFKVYKNWLALVYTAPEKRHQGLGAVLCKHIQQYA